MARRVHVDRVEMGRVTLGAAQGHHLRDVLRMEAGMAVELFDDTGAVGQGVIAEMEGVVVVDVRQVEQGAVVALVLTIAAAVPKGPRADWMVEKLSELGVARFIPLAAERSVVVPEGKNKLQRWRRIATEAAKQSRRRGVMEVTDVQRVDQVLTCGGRAWVCATEMPAVEVLEAGRGLRRSAGEATPVALTALVGPEGGWAPAEVEQFRAAGLTAITLGTTILRVETAAVALAAVAAGVLTPLLQSPGPDPRDS